MESKTRTGVRALLAGALVTAMLAAPTPASAQPLAHPEDDYAGSQIARHEGTATAPPLDVRANDDVMGLDVASYQGNVDWAAVSRNGGSFAYAKATEGITYTNPSFGQQHGGAWSRDGRTLPPALDIEYNPYGDTCYKLTPDQMTAWIKAFSDQSWYRT